MIAAEKTYNGWANYETWLTSLWLDNDESTYDDCRRLARKATSVYRLADDLKDYVNELPELEAASNCGGFVADLVGAALSEVDWLEIARHYLEDNKPEPVSYAELKQALREDDMSDPWAVAMGAMFDVTHELHFVRQEPTPAEWQFRPSPLGDDDENERSYLRTEYLAQAETDDVLRFGALLNRYCDRLRHAGRDY